MAHPSINFSEFTSNGKLWKASTSRETLTVNAVASDPNLVVTSTLDFNQEGLGVVLFGAGAATTLAVPSMTATVIAPPGTALEPLQIAVAAITEDMGCSAAAELNLDAPSTLDASHFVRLTPTATVTAVYQYIVWARRGSGAWQYLGGMIANPLAFPELVRFDITSLTAVPAVEYLPPQPPTAALPGWLRTRIASVEPQGADWRITLDDAPITAVTGKTLVHDNAIVLQKAIGAGIRRITVPIGGYRMFGNITIAHPNPPVHIEGDLLQYDVEVEVPLSPIFEFTPGFGLFLAQEACIFENLVFRGRSRWAPPGETIARAVPSLPAGGRFISEDGHHGAGVLAMRRCIWVNSVFSLFHGTGHALWGVANQNPNMSYLERCVAGKNTAHGFYGGNGLEASDLAWMRCYAETNKHWGFYDTGFLGNHMYGCHTYGNAAGPYRLAAEDNAGCSTLIASYAEENQGPSIAGPKAVVMGGNLGSGFTPASPGLRIRSRNEVSPFQLVRRSADGEPWFMREMGFTGEETDTANEALVQLERYTSAKEPLDYFMTWRRSNYVPGFTTKAIQRIQYHVAHTTSMEWCHGELRGKSQMAFSRGFLLQGSNDAGYERRVLGLAAIDSPSYGTFEPGDIIIDNSGKNYFFRPRKRCGSGVQWQANTGYTIGDTVEPTTPNDYVYVARYLVGAAARKAAGVSGNSEPPSWPITPGAEITDGEVVWMCWGPNQRDFERVGRQSIEAATEALTIGAHDSVDREFVHWDAEDHDTVVATPLGEPAARLLWNGFVRITGRVNLRLANVGSTALTLPAMTWTIDCWKH